VAGLLNPAVFIFYFEGCFSIFGPEPPGLITRPLKGGNANWHDPLFDFFRLFPINPVAHERRGYQTPHFLNDNQ
jgi:hypothetical protein